MPTRTPGRKETSSEWNSKGGLEPAARGGGERVSFNHCGPGGEKAREIERTIECDYTLAKAISERVAVIMRELQTNKPTQTSEGQNKTMPNEIQAESETGPSSLCMAAFRCH